MPPTISIIIPVLNEEALLAGTLDGLRRFKGEPEVIVVDGGSHDLTCDIARTALQQFSQGQLIESARGRGPQMNAGAHQATGEAFVFLHADSRLPILADEMISASLKTSAWGRFRSHWAEVAAHRQRGKRIAASATSHGRQAR